MVHKIRDTEKSLGNINYELTEKQVSGKYFPRSLYVIEDVSKGETFTDKNVKSIRPGYGLHPKHLPKIIGTYANQDIVRGTRFDLSFIED